MIIETVDARVELPRGPIQMMQHPDQREEATIPRNELETVFGLKLVRAVDEYSRLLSGDSAYLKRNELAKVSEAELGTHLQQVRNLRDFLTAFSGDPRNFVVREQRVSEDEDLYVARVRGADLRDIGVGWENAQRQFSIYTELRNSPEGRDIAIRFASLRRGVDPARAAEIADKEVDYGAVTVNGVLLCRESAGGRIVAAPEAGIRIAKVGDFIDIDGVKPIGAAQFHYFPVPDEGDIDFTLGDFQTLRSIGIRLSGYIQSQPIQPADLQPKPELPKP